MKDRSDGKTRKKTKQLLNYFNISFAKLNPICHLLALLGAHHILHLSRIRVKEREYTGN
jgi:hypothetical protein